MHHGNACKPGIAARSRGLGAIAALVILVLMSGLAAAVVRLGWSAQTGIAMDVLGARALRAANAGVDWGLFMALQGGVCGSQTLDLRADTGFRVTVTCTSTTFTEGEVVVNMENSTTAAQTVTLYTISAVACNGGATCPDNAAAAGVNYVERERLAHASQ